MSTPLDLAPFCRVPPVPGSLDLQAFLATHPAADDRDTVGAALSGGHAAPTLGFAFAAGYRAALRALVPSLGEGLAALCVTEDAGNQPKHLSTELVPTPDGFLLRGDKSFVTLGRLADTLLVAAVTHRDEAGRKRVALARVQASHTGVTFEDLPPLPFVPEVPHARVRFASVPLAREDVLAGDGWAAYVKPFRTIEDLHVVAAVVGHTLGLVASGAEAQPEGGLAIACLAHALAGYAWEDPALHLALDGLFVMAGSFVRAVVSTLPAERRSIYERDLALLGTAEGARRQRSARAREALGLPAVTGAAEPGGAAG